MKTYRTLLLLVFVGTLIVILQSGCIHAGGASYVKSKMGIPMVFEDVIEAKGISKKTQSDGKEVYKAEELTHKTTILTFVREVEYKDATLKTKGDK